MSDRLLLIDSINIMNKAFYGLPYISTTKGRQSNAVNGFVNILFSTIDEVMPQYVAAVFDDTDKQVVPAAFREQISDLKKLLLSMNIEIVEQSGKTASDIISDIANKSIKSGMEVVFLPEKDGECVDCVDKEVVTDVELKYIPMDIYTSQAYGILREYEFNSILGRFDQSVSVEDRAGFGVNFLKSMDELREVFGTIKKAGKCSLVNIIENKSLLGTAVAVEREGRIESYFYNISGEKKHRVKEGQLSLFADEDGMLCMGGNEDKYDSEVLEEAIRELLDSVMIFTVDIKPQYRCLDTASTYNYFDVLIAAYLINPLKSDYDIQSIASEYLDFTIERWDARFGKKNIADSMASDIDGVCEYFCCVVYATYKAGELLQDNLVSTGMDKLMKDMEMPLSLVLYDMEKEGVEVRPDELKAYGDALKYRIDELEKSIHEQAGMDFNINSPKQLGEVLFGHMNLPGGKKTKSGYSTAAEVLEKLAEDYPIVNDVLEYRGLTKLKSTYADGLAAFIGEDKRIHTNFNQTITATGRISSTEPNLQNIPMRMELGRRIRKAFVPKKGYVLMDADYSQIELRVLAHMSGDRQLIEAYRMDEDIHKITASQVFHVPFDEVTSLQRRNAKAVNFGIVYGISSFGLSQDLSISRKEAKDYIEQYFKTYPGVKSFLDGLVAEAKNNGYVTTMYGRRRPIPELSSSNFMTRSFGERVAMNSPIQGTAADIIKIAMIKVWRALKEQGLKSKLILQVHDELVIETLKEEEEPVRKILEDNMKSAAELAVSLEVDLHTGENWYEAK